MKKVEKPFKQHEESFQNFGNNKISQDLQDQDGYHTQKKSNEDLSENNRTNDRSLCEQDDKMLTNADTTHVAIPTIESFNKLMKRKSSMLSNSSKSSKKEKALIQFSQERDEVEYPFRKYCEVNSSLGMLKKMSYKIPLRNLYQLQETCTRNQNNPYCAITVFIRDAELQKKYGGRYLIQVWFDKIKLFQKVNTNGLQTFKMIGHYFIFLENPTNKSSIFKTQEDFKSTYHIVKFSEAKLQFRMELTIVNKQNQPITEHLAAIYKGKLIIASQNQARYLEIKELKASSSISETLESYKVEVQYSDFKLIHLNEDEDKGALKIHNIQETVERGGIMFVVERLNLGKLSFLHLEELSSGEAKTRDLDIMQPKIKKESPTQPPSEILSYKSIICQIEGQDSYKQVGIALRKDFSVDLYYEYTNVWTMESSRDCLYFATDVDFNRIYLYSYGLRKGEQVITETTCDVSWMQSGQPFWEKPKKEKIFEFQEEFENQIKEYSIPDYQESWKECLAWKFGELKSCQFDDQEDLLKLLSFYLNDDDEELNSICSNFIEFYSSFINNGSQVIVSHDRFISSYNIMLQSWDTQHLECEDFIRQMFRSRTTADGKILEIGILVGYQRFRFLEMNPESLEFKFSTEKKIAINTEDPILSFLNDIDSQKAFYFICQKNAHKNQPYFEKIEQQTWIHIPIQKLGEVNSLTINVLIDH